MVGNHRPSFGDTTGDGITRRLVLLECQSIPKDRRDPQMLNKLTQPAALSALLHWMVDGFEMFKMNNYQISRPSSVTELNEAAFSEDDRLPDFLNEKVGYALNFVNHHKATRLLIQVQVWFI
ncbi:MAG: hypothetical protein OXE94_07360 [Aestuariivita sp.]|nr:hypothetical protein [Aestuariivita sp.]MCY4202050.1 hypothetical protein [Aestuariivita sp.]